MLAVEATITSCSVFCLPHVMVPRQHTGKADTSKGRQPQQQQQQQQGWLPMTAVAVARVKLYPIAGFAFANSIVISCSLFRTDTTVCKIVVEVLPVTHH
jgi:hypothetical protein